MTRATILWCLLIWSGICCAETPVSVSMLDCFRFEPGQERVHYLPAELREISGLATSPKNTLLTHNDEKTSVYELVPQTGQITALQTDRVVASNIDYEGVTVTGTHLLMVSSKGKFARIRYPLNQSSFEFWSSKLNKICEVEGLTDRDSDAALVVVCKKIKDPKNKREIRLLVIHPGSQKTEPGQISVSIPKGHKSGIKEFSGSGVVYYEPWQRYLVLSSKKPAIAELSEEGELINVMALPKKLHRQPEGITITADQELIIANEGGKAEGYLVTYQSRQSCLAGIK